MKKFILTALLLHIAVLITSAQNSDAILGTWLSPNGHTSVLITKNGDLFQGVIIAPKQGKKAAADTGVVILKDFKYRGNNVYNRGKVIDSKSGRTYNGQMKLINPQTLNIRIFFGIIQFGRTETWTRIVR